MRILFFYGSKFLWSDDFDFRMLILTVTDEEGLQQILVGLLMILPYLVCFSFFAIQDVNFHCLVLSSMWYYC